VQYEQKENKRNIAEQHQGLEEENGPPDEDVNAMEVFRDFHTIRKNGMDDAARAADLLLLPLKSTEAIAIKEGNVAGA
jgi:hypothetical protein